jgi:hypothetical protein
MTVRVLLTGLSIVLLAGCGVSGDSVTLVDAALPSNRFCGNLLGLTRELGSDKRDPVALKRLADRLDTDEQTLIKVRDVPVAKVARRLADGVRGPIDWPNVEKALDALPDDVCYAPPAYTWEHGGKDLMELQVPRGWRALSEKWNLPGRGVVGTALRIGESMTFGPSPLGDDYRWIFPTAYLAVSRSLAKELGVKGGRTGVALDRIRHWMDSTTVPASCRNTRIVPYVKGVMWGFMRRSDGCGGFGSALIEIYAVALHRRYDAAVVLLRLTGRHTGSIPVFRRAVESFHVVH